MRGETMKKALLALALFVVGGNAVSAQTTYNLSDSSCKVQGTNYLYCSGMGGIRVDGTVYSVFLSAVDITNLYQNPSSAPVSTAFGSINFQNVNTTVTTTIYPFTSGTYTDRHLTLLFSGAFSGSIDLDLVVSVQTPPCYRGCRTFWTAENVVLTLN
jgi:hypothetical protein